jgi:hypothetical protein
MARIATRIADLGAALVALGDAAEPEAWGDRAPDVSGWSVAQHVDHLAVANLSCLRAAVLLLEGEDERIVSTGSPTMAGRKVLTLGRIPRGRAQAPDGTEPAPDPALEEVRVRLDEGRILFERLRADPEAVASAPGRIPHPLLGPFTAAQWVRFTAVHVRHHLAIVGDVLQRSR